MFELHRETVVGTGPAEVWEVVGTFAGVNAELMPMCKMVEPPSLRGRTLDSWVQGERAACWLRAGGVVPFDRHLLGLESVEPGVGFIEESTSWLQRRWRHERTLSAEGTGTRIADHLTVQPRLPFADGLTKWLVGRIFDHRHHQLIRRFGEPGSVPG